jgi:Heparinase II/III-like protein
VLVRALLGPPRPASGRPSRRPDRFADAGLSILRTEAEDSLPELWCRLDGGPHGFLSIAAHAHADALSVEVRHGGTDILADPGTYCYHGEPEWRRYFQSTIGHNTVELDGRWQSERGGAFLWLRHAAGRELAVNGDSWSGEHDGYAPAVHKRSVQLDRDARSLEIADQVSGGTSLRLAFHLGPDVEVSLAGSVAQLTWPGGSARLELPGELGWSAHRGETDPILGWYSTGLGHRQPAWTLLGTGPATPGHVLITHLAFDQAVDLSDGALSARHYDVRGSRVPDTRNVPDS